VLDLDTTLWGGVVGDDGLKGIQIAQGDAAGEACLDFQRFILALRGRGVVLAVSSKNEDETARLPFRNHPEMLLRGQHFAVFQANWSDKATNIQAIAKKLSLGLNSFVSVDDNPFERKLVRKMLPQAAVPEMPADPVLYTRTLSAAGCFEAAAFSEEDLNRASYFDGNARRAALQKNVLVGLWHGQTSEFIFFGFPAGLRAFGGDADVVSRRNEHVARQIESLALDTGRVESQDHGFGHTLNQHERHSVPAAPARTTDARVPQAAAPATASQAIRRFQWGRIAAGNWPPTERNRLASCGLSAPVTRSATIQMAPPMATAPNMPT
jgi:HAD superfamily phosphatase (TIGR01681 family)